MKSFTEAYKKARKVTITQNFGWNQFLKINAPVSSLLRHNGLNTAQAMVPYKVRSKIYAESLRTAFGFIIGHSEGAAIWEGAGNSSTGSRAERAATIKFVEGIHRVYKRGAQDVWVYNPPKKYTGWVFDEIKGTASTCVRKLGYTKRMFSYQQMKHMEAALQQALATSQKVVTKLGTPDAATKQKVRDWFCDDHSSATQLSTALSKLKLGMAKIVSLCNSNTLVFTDLPMWRAKRGKIYGGAWVGGEGGGFPVIYLEGCFTKLAGNSGKMWLCAETIVHEASHHEVKTHDHFYDGDGLKPSAAKFPAAKALDNADNWGYFVIDVAGKLSNADRAKTLKVPTRADRTGH